MQLCSFSNMSAARIWGIIFSIMLVGMLITSIISAASCPGIEDTELRNAILDGPTDTVDLNWDDYEIDHSQLEMNTIDYETMEALELETKNHEEWLQGLSDIAADTDTDMGSQVSKICNDNLVDQTDFNFGEVAEEDGNYELTYDQRSEIALDHGSRHSTQDFLPDLADTGNQGMAIATGVLGVATGVAGAGLGWELSKQSRKSDPDDPKPKWKWAHFAIVFYFLLTIAVMLAAFGAAHGNSSMAIAGVALMGLMVPICGAQYSWHSWNSKKVDMSKTSTDLIPTNANAIIPPVTEYDYKQIEGFQNKGRRLVTLQRIMQTMNATVEH